MGKLRLWPSGVVLSQYLWLAELEEIKRNWVLGIVDPV